MTGFLENDFLEFEGLDQQDIADLNAAIPDIQHLLQVIQQEWPTINKVAPVLLRIGSKVATKQESLK